MLNKLIKLIVNKFTKKNLYKLISGIIISIILRYIAVYYQEDITNNYPILNNDLILSFYITCFLVSKEIIITLLEMFDIPNSSFILEILNISNKQKIKLNIDEDISKNVFLMETNNQEIGTYNNKGKRKATEEDLIEEYSKRPKPEEWIKTKYTDKPWHQLLTTGTWNKQVYVFEKITEKHSATITEDDFKTLIKELWDKMESVTFSEKSTGELRTILLRANHIPPIIIDIDTLNNNSLSHYLIVCYHSALKKQMEAHKLCYKFSENMANELEIYDKNKPLSSISKKHKKVLNEGLKLTGRVAYDVIYDENDQLIEHLIHNLRMQATLFKDLHESPIINKTIETNTKNLKTVLGSKYDELVKKEILSGAKPKISPKIIELVYPENSNKSDNK
jgi:hypothetical protein